MPYKVSHVHKQKKISFSNLTVRPLLPDQLARSYNVLHEVLPRHVTLPHVRHKHTSEFVYCLKGNFTVVLNKTKFLLKEGSMVWIPPGVWHTFKTKKSDAAALSIFSPPLNLKKKADVEVKSTHGRKL